MNPRTRRLRRVRRRQRKREARIDRWASVTFGIYPHDYKCEHWNDDDAGFAEIVAGYLALTGIDQRAVADEFDAAISTVSRWARGVAKPHIRTQREVVEWIGKKATKAASRTSGAIPVFPMAAKGRE